MTNPYHPEHTRITREKNTFTIAAGKTETIFHETREDGWVQEILVFCNSKNITLGISLGTHVDSMKILDAYNYRLLYPNTSFWVGRYDTSNNLFSLMYHPFNHQPYQGSVTVKLINEGSTEATITKVIFKRIRMKLPLVEEGVEEDPLESGQEYPPYSVQHH